MLIRDADDVARQRVLHQPRERARQQAGRRPGRQRYIYDHDQHQVYSNRAAGHEPRKGRLKGQGGGHRQDDPDGFHCDGPSAASRAEVGVRTTSTFSSAEKSTAGFTVIRLYALPLFSTVSTRPMANPFG